MNLGWLVIGLSAVVVGIGGYVALLVRRRKTLEARLDELRPASTED